MEPKIYSYTKPYLILYFSKKYFGVNYGLIELLNNCDSKDEFMYKFKYYIKGVFINDKFKKKIIDFINLNTKIRTLLKKIINKKRSKIIPFSNDTDIMSFDTIDEVEKNDIYNIYDYDEKKKILV